MKHRYEIVSKARLCPLGRFCKTTSVVTGRVDCMLSVDLVDSQSGACVSESAHQMSRASEVVDYFIHHHGCNHSQGTTIIIHGFGAVIPSTDECVQLFAMIGRINDGSYLAHWQSTETGIHAYIRYDYESAVTWICTVCEYYLRLIRPASHLFRPIEVAPAPLMGEVSFCE